MLPRVKERVHGQELPAHPSLWRRLEHSVLFIPPLLVPWRWCAGWGQQTRMGRGKAEGELWLVCRENIFLLLCIKTRQK